MVNAGKNVRRTLALRVSARRYRLAEAMARECAGHDLPFVVRAFVADLASAARRGRYCWQHERLSQWFERHPWPAPSEVEGPFRQAQGPELVEGPRREPEETL